MASYIARRKFLATLGGAAAWPLAARAQQGERMRRIGVLVAPVESDREAQLWISALREGLEKLGWNHGGNLRMRRVRRGANQTGDANDTGRVRRGQRSGRQWVRCKCGAAGWQRHRLCAL